MLRCRIRYRSRDIEVGVGDFVVGRSGECQLVVDDPMVSRRHALFRVEAGRALVEDLGSRNGVLVNGEALPVRGARALGPQDVVTVGEQDLRVLLDEVPDGTPRSVPPAHPETPTTLSPDEQTREGPSILAALVAKSLALGHIDDAERILGGMLAELVVGAPVGRSRSPQVVEQAAWCALHVAAATSRARWVDAAFEVYRAARRPMPAPMVDELHVLVRKVRCTASPALRAYVEWVRTESTRWSPGERFLLQRLEGLERVLRSQ